MVMISFPFTTTIYLALTKCFRLSGFCMEENINFLITFLYIQQYSVYNQIHSFG